MNRAEVLVLCSGMGLLSVDGLLWLSLHELRRRHEKLVKLHNLQAKRFAELSQRVASLERNNVSVPFPQGVKRSSQLYPKPYPRGKKELTVKLEMLPTRQLGVVESKFGSSDDTVRLWKAPIVRENGVGQ